MTYLEELQTAHKHRMERFSRVSPTPPRMRPKIIEIVNGKQAALKDAASAAVQISIAQASSAFEQGPPTVREIQRTVASHYRVSFVYLVSDRRNKAVVLPRHVAMYLAKTFTFHSHPQIGRMFQRDHTTILFAVRKIGSLIQSEPAIAA